MVSLNPRVKVQLCTVIILAVCVLSPYESTIKKSVHDMDSCLTLLIVTGINIQQPLKTVYVYFAGGAYDFVCFCHTWSKDVLLDSLDNVSMTISDSETVFYERRSPKG